MAMPKFFGGSKADHPLDKDLTQAREANATAFDGLLGEIGALLSGEPKATPAIEPRRAAAGRPWPPQRH